VSLDGVIQAPGGKDEDRDGGFEHGGWTIPYWHDDIGKSFDAVMQQGVDAFLLAAASASGQRTRTPDSRCGPPRRTRLAS
jgi:hypothetical protein